MSEDGITYSWHVSATGTIKIIKNIQSNGFTIGHEIVRIPSEALRHAIRNATGQGDGYARSGEVEIDDV